LYVGNESSTLTWQGRLHWDLRIRVVHYPLHTGSCIGVRFVGGYAQSFACRPHFPRLLLYPYQRHRRLLRHARSPLAGYSHPALERIGDFLRFIDFRRPASGFLLAGLRRFRIIDRGPPHQPLRLPDRAAVEVQNPLITCHTPLQIGSDRDGWCASFPIRIQKWFCPDWP
jgi:hypothetical protein